MHHLLSQPVSWCTVILSTSKCAVLNNYFEHMGHSSLSTKKNLTQTIQQRPFNGLWSGTTRVGRYQKEHSPTHTHPDHRASFIIKRKRPDNGNDEFFIPVIAHNMKNYDSHLIIKGYQRGVSHDISVIPSNRQIAFFKIVFNFWLRLLIN